MNYFTSINKIFEYQQYSLRKEQKEKLLLPYFSYLNLHHKEKCLAYGNIVNKLFKENKFDICRSMESLPYIPVQLFKDFELMSINKNEVFKTMLSSGTSGNKLSKIFLNKATSSLQTKVLSNIVSSFLGNKRVPMLIIDCPKTLKDRSFFSVRRAATLGFSIFGKDIYFALDDEMNLDEKVIKEFEKKSNGRNSLIFGFTNIIWTNFINSILKNNININLNKSILIHGGGWKKLADQKITSKDFKDLLLKATNIKDVVNYYGMVEQTGSVYMECEKGFLHCSNFADILVRNERNFSVNKFNQKGLIQVLSILPYSYPGHSLLTEDLGQIYGEDDCDCGRKGKYFKVFGRIPKAEIRGCSDAY